MDPAAVDDDTDDGGGKLPPIVLDDSLCTTEQHFVVMGRSMKTLFVLALGQKDEAGKDEAGVELVYMDKLWSLQKKKEIKLTRITDRNNQHVYSAMEHGCR
jgi:hypothetical protein